jgi:hypothetical protein
LKVCQVDFNANVIRLDPTQAKNKEAREVAMTRSIRALLVECAEGKKPEDALFTRDRSGKPVRTFRKAWENLCVQAGMGKLICLDCGKSSPTRTCACGGKTRYEGLILHDMRRTAARNLRRAGVAEGVIMKLGGWKTRSMFERYNIVDQRDLRDALDKLEAQRVEEERNWHKVSHNSLGDPQPVERKVN